MPGLNLWVKDFKSCYALLINLVSNVFTPFFVRVSAYQPFIALYVYALLVGESGLEPEKTARA